MRTQVSRTLQYFYFLRFSIALWLFPLAFFLFDSGMLPFSSRTLTRGIFVPEYWSGYLCVAFYLISGGFVALVTARTTVINGNERFSSLPPTWLESLLDNDKAEKEGRTVAYSLIPTALTYLYLFVDGHCETVEASAIIVGIVTGTLAGLVFWYLLNAWYYLAYTRPSAPHKDELLQLGVNAARTILFPRRWFCLKPPGDLVLGNPLTLEDIETSLRGNGFGKPIAVWTLPGGKSDLRGYASESGRIYEAQIFASISTIGFIVLFWVLYPLTAPEPTAWSRLAFAVILLSLVLVLRVFLTGRCPDTKLLRFWQLVLSVGAIGFCGVIPLVYCFSSPDRFPTLASVLLLMIVLISIFGGLAFLLDRYRVPVLTFFVLLAILPRVFHFYFSFEEHYISTSPIAATDAASELSTPAQILDNRLRAELAKPEKDRRPFIIVTATGGGLHASAWTARVIEKLNAQFSKTEAENFRSHILLMSTVSGSSVSLSYYLREIDSRRNGGDPNFQRMVIASQCSSLEAVGWGLIYYDVPKAIVFGLPWLLHASPGENDLHHSPLFKDRTWALRRGFDRNADDSYCVSTASRNDTSALPTPKEPPRRPWYRRICLRCQWPSHRNEAPPMTLADLKNTSQFPAFTMNTTTAEYGDRFLLANYRLPDYPIGPMEDPPAESFLSLLGSQADLPLVSAAQMSATFPYISSAARIPMTYATNSVHFIDGGYFDNDGTSSAIEFLRYALDDPALGFDPTQGRDDPSTPKSNREKVGQLGFGHLKIILIEIRNSKDTDSPGNAETPKAINPSPDGEKVYPSGMVDQLVKPLEGFWNAGHDSTTGRDRNGLDLLVRAHQNDLELHQVVLDDQTEPGYCCGIKAAQDPLSWSLTPKERKEVEDYTNSKMQPCFEHVRKWFADFDSGWDPSLGLPYRCSPPAPVSSDHAQSNLHGNYETLARLIHLRPQRYHSGAQSSP